MATTGRAHTVVVLTALECEYLAVRALLVEPRLHRHAAGTHFEIGNVSNGEIVLTLVGAGNQGAAALTERAITEFGPSAVLFVGVAGALHADIALGTVVVGTKVYSYQGGLEQDSGFAARPQAWEADHGLDQIARSVSRSKEWALELPDGPPLVLFRPIAAGEVVLNSRDTPLAHQLRIHYSDAAAIEMESAGMAKAAHLNRAPCLTIRSISDRADGQKHAVDGAGWQHIAARNAAAFAMTVAHVVLATTSNTLLPGGNKQQGTANDNDDTTLHNNSTRSAGNPVQIQGWQPLQHAVDVVWRSDLFKNRFSGEKAALEIHIIPAGNQPRLQMRSLVQMNDELPAHGRAYGLFTSTEQLRGEYNNQVAWVRSADYGRGPHGLAVFRSGQRSSWSPLPHDPMGAVLDPDDLPDQIARSLRIVLALNNLPEPDDIALAAAIEPATLVTEDSVSGFPRTQASGIRTAAHVRLQPEDKASYSWLSTRTDEAAQELAARLHTKFRATR